MILLLRLDKSIDQAERKVQIESARYVHLQKVLADLEEEQKLDNEIAPAPPAEIIKKTNVIEPSILNKSTKKANFEPIVPVDSNRRPAQPMAASLYIFNFKSPIHLDNSHDIIQLAGKLEIHFTSARVPDNMLAGILVKENTRDEKDKVVQTDFSLVTADVSADSSFKCVFREKPSPDVNEFGLPEHQRKLTISLTGSLRNSSIDVLVGWEELSGRPDWARLKIPMALK